MTTALEILAQESQISRDAQALARALLRSTQSQARGDICEILVESLASLMREEFFNEKRRQEILDASIQLNNVRWR